MIENRLLSEELQTNSKKKLKDGPEKRILANKQILARILKGILPELRKNTVEEIMQEWLQDPVEITQENVLELKQEIIQKNNHKMMFDIHFLLRKGEEKIEVNLEIQDRYDPGYPLVKRGIVYCAAMLANHLGNIIRHSHY